MSLQELVVEDLFGEFTHTIKFRTTEGLTIIHGPNGAGKTTILRILDLLFNQKFSTLRQIPFSVLNVSFTEGDRLQVTRTSEVSGKSKEKNALEFILTPAKGAAQTWTYQSSSRQEFPTNAIEAIIPNLSRIGPNEWQLLSSGEILNLDEVVERYGERLSAYGSLDSASRSPEWLRLLLARIPVYFIETDRLSSNAILRSQRSARRSAREIPRTPTVLLYAEDLSDLIEKTKADYGDYSQSLDSTFPARLLQPKVPTSEIPSDDAIRARYTEQAARRNRFVKAGLLDSGDELRLPDQELDQAERRVLDAYLTDVDDKLNQLDAMADKLELFLQIVNNKFRRKSIVIDRENGVRAITEPQGEELALRSLSSGEQQELVLSYGLLFHEDPGTLILLDEPELSLHVSWQIDLIPDLLRISEVSQLKFLIATHSPQIINDRWDLTDELSDDA